jgi:hypothetical protein
MAISSILSGDQELSLPLIEADDDSLEPIWLKKWWRITHFLGFFIGGTTFIFGTLCYYFPKWTDGAFDAAFLYTLGSVGFLYVDLLEFFTFTDNGWMRANIAISAVGSTCYVIGSVGFFPTIFNTSMTCGLIGFIVGSAFISASQTWKILRLRREEGSMFNSVGTATQVGVEGGAMIGGYCFLVGTAMFASGKPLEGARFETILAIWLVGSIGFTIGSIFLWYRHFVMGV